MEITLYQRHLANKYLIQMVEKLQKSIKFTREQAIEEHRKMWNWIADKLASDDCKKYDSAYYIKAEYIFQTYGKDGFGICEKCFLCHYIYSISSDCTHCPLDWGDNNTCNDGLYSKFKNLVEIGSNKEASIIARQIANLPEKKEEVVKMELTREEAIAEHRKMWNWIADKLQSDDCEKYYNANDIKIDYLDQRYGENKHCMSANCFLCEYDSSVIIEGTAMQDCDHCPLDWGEIACSLNGGLYDRFSKLIEDGKFYKEASVIARQIANLPEKKEG